MKTLTFRILAILALSISLFSCEDDDVNPIIVSGDYPVKEYYLERDPNVNVWGAGMDFIHSETELAETDLDYEYLEETDDFEYDIKFYTVKSYYSNNEGDLVAEGCPAMLLALGVQACKIGEGVTFFDECTEITSDMQALLTTEPQIDYEACKNEDGQYDRTLIFDALSNCVIGRSFRSNVLVVPEGSTEQEAQAVYLVKTREGGYAKFMVKQFKGEAPHTKQTVVRWQVISE